MAVRRLILPASLSSTQVWPRRIGAAPGAADHPQPPLWELLSAWASAVLPPASYRRLQEIKAAYDPDQAIISTHPVQPTRP